MATGLTVILAEIRNGSFGRDMAWKLGVLTGASTRWSRLGLYSSAIVKRHRRFGGNFDRHVLRPFTLGLSTRRVREFFESLFGPYGLAGKSARLGRR